MTQVNRAYTSDYLAALLALNAYCGCDSISDFKGRMFFKSGQISRFVVPSVRLGIFFGGREWSNGRV